jgi:hypothetical protein
MPLEARVFSVEHIFRYGGEYTGEIKEKSAKMFPESQVPHCNTALPFVGKVRGTGSVGDALRYGKPRVLTEDTVWTFLIELPEECHNVDD